MADISDLDEGGFALKRPREEARTGGENARGATTQISAKRQLAGLPTYALARLGVLALVVCLSGYLYRHLFVLGYIVAFYGFAVADILFRPAYDPAANRDTFQVNWPQLNQTLSYVLFAAAPFERTCFYATESPLWLGAVGFVVELIGLSISLVARLQLGRFGTPHLALQEHQHVVQSGLYRRVRHPLYAGGLLSSVAWPIIYGAPVTIACTLTVRVLMLRRRIGVEETMMRERFGAEYEAYAQRTRRLIPGIY